MAVIQIAAKQLKIKLENQENLLLLDVREQNEFDYTHIAGSQLIPMNQIPQRLAEIDSTKDCVVICHHGMRSQQVADFLVHSGFKAIYNLTGGIEAWATQCDSTILRY
ncbi:MAG: rhodanese-like domain-containing protein [Methylococcales bacterium]|jgi:rhodanese-related sulfurtransferase